MSQPTRAAAASARARPGKRKRRGAAGAGAAGAGRLLAVTEEEIQRIVLDIHDGPVQDIFAALSQLGSLRSRLSRPGSPAEASALALSIRLLESSLRGIRGLLSTLRGPAFAERSLVELLEEPAVEHEALTGAAVRLDFDGNPSVPLSVKLGLYRILQEALSNVRRHSHVARASVLLKTGNGRIVLEVADEGRGFDPPPLTGPEATQRPEHIGLRGMRERAVLMNGSLRILSRPGRGTRVRVEVPLGG